MVNFSTIRRVTGIGCGILAAVLTGRMVYDHLTTEVIDVGDFTDDDLDDNDDFFGNPDVDDDDDDEEEEEDEEEKPAPKKEKGKK